VSEALVIRDARRGDEAAIHALLWEFAEFEKLTHRFHLTPEIVSRDLMGEQRRVQCDVAEWDGALVAVMIWYRAYGSFSASIGARPAPEWRIYSWDADAFDQLADA